MKKDLFVSFINKHLSQDDDKILWELKDNKIKTRSLTNTTKSSVLCEVNAGNVGIEDSRFVICDSKRILKQLSVFSDGIDVSILKSRDICVKILFKDGVFEGACGLGDLGVLDEMPSVIEVDYEIVLQLTSELVDRFLKAKRGNSEADTIFMYAKEKKWFFVTGDDHEYSNKITFSVDIPVDIKTDKFHFPADLFNNIISINKDFDEAIISLSTQGLVKFFFSKKIEDIKLEAEYYIVPFENI